MSAPAARTPHDDELQRKRRLAARPDASPPAGTGAPPAPELGPEPAVSGVVLPVGGLPVPSGSMSELRRRRLELAERVAALTWDLGGLAYEMAVRDHYRLDVLARKAAELQEVDAQLGEVQRLLADGRGRHPRPVPLLRRGSQPRRGLLLALRRTADPGGPPARSSRSPTRPRDRPGSAARCSSVRPAPPQLPSAVAYGVGMRRSSRALALLGALLGVRGGGAHTERGLREIAAIPAPVWPGQRASPPEYKCQVFPADNPLNQEVANAPVNPNSANYVASIGLTAHLHPDFGTNPTYGIPYAVVGPEQPEVPIKFTEFGEESNPGPYPIPPHAPVEGAGKSGDRHVLVAQEGTCMLYELYDAHRHGAGWSAASGAVFNLASNALRPEGWTSADAAGLPIFPLLVRYPEVAGGADRPRAARHRA